MQDEIKAQLIEFLVERLTEDQLMALWSVLLPHLPVPNIAKVLKHGFAEQLIEKCTASNRVLNLIDELERLRPDQSRTLQNLKQLALVVDLHFDDNESFDIQNDDDARFGQSDVREQVRLDAATPSNVFVNEPFDMAVAVLQTGASPLHVDGLPRVTSVEGEVVRSSEDQVVTYRVEVVPNVYLDVQPPSYVFQLASGKDSKPFFFQIIAKSASKRSLVLNAFQVDRGFVVASTRLVLTVGIRVDEPRDDGDALKATHQTVALINAMATSGALGDGSKMAERPADLMKLDLLERLDQTYSTEELMDACFALDVDFDNLKGDTKRSKARDLILFLIRRGELQRLVELVSNQRPSTATMTPIL